MPRRVPLILVTLPLVTALIGLGPAAATSDQSLPRAAPPSTVKVKLGTLPRGGHAKTPYLIGRDLHLADGRVRRLPFSKAAAADLVLAGRTRSGWVIGARPSPGYDFILVRGKRKTFIHRPQSDDSTDEYRLNRAGTRLLVSYRDRGDSSTLFVHKLDGTRVGLARLNVAADLLDFADGRAFLASGTRTRRWRPGVGFTTVVAQPSASADAPRDLLFVWDPDRQGFGPTALSAPATPAWAASFQPTEVSPDATKVVGYQVKAGQPTDRIDVRRMSDGTRIASFDPGHSQTLRWEDDSHLLWTDYRRASGVGQHALVRCSLTGGCQRITDYVKRNQFSFPSP